jgi:hypothetical protein
MLPGCNGCRREAGTLADKTQRRERTAPDEQKRKPDFLFRQLNTLPHASERLCAIKPGHWTSASLLAIANNYDFRGQVAVDPLDLDETPFRLGTIRPAVLPKGQRRELDLLIYPPPGLNPRGISASLRTASGREVYRESFPLVRVPAHQFYLTVLAKAPESYGFLRRLDSVQAPGGEFGLSGTDPHYRLLAPLVAADVPLPSSSLTWTSIAYIIWDDFDPQLLTRQQQQALLDWLHWGGQLIISGPGSLGPLQGSFLSGHLPAFSDGTAKLEPAGVEELSRRWSPPGDRLQLTRPWTIERLRLAQDAQVALSGDGVALVVDRRCGRGRVAITAFALSSRPLTEWTGFDNFFNGCLLRRPARHFKWEDEAVAFHWQDGAPRRDPRRISQLRYFSRDAGARRAWHRWGIELQTDESDPSQIGDPFAPAGSDALESSYGPGVAGWDDFGEVSTTARKALLKAAGILIPRPSFVVWALAAYLGVVVPLNWAVFRAIGRVELAWLAAPLIALAAAVAVVRAAQLDIGFVRAASHLAVVELQPHYRRAHVTRYTALYTSLATGYDIAVDDPGGLVQPFPDGTGVLRGQRRRAVNLQGGDRVTLRDFRVSSNSIGMLHAEHMLPITGGIELTTSVDGQLRITNRSPWLLEDVRIVHAGRRAVIGRLRAGESKPFALNSQELAEHEISKVDETNLATQVEAPDAIAVESLLALAEADAAAQEWRLVGATKNKVPGLEIRPFASQRREVSVIVAHLDYGAIAAPESDTVTSVEVKQKMGVVERRGQHAEDETVVP